MRRKRAKVRRRSYPGWVGALARASFSVSGTIAATLALAQCATPEAPPSDPWDAAYADAALLTDSEYLLEALADGRVDAAEYSDSVSRYLECVNAFFPELQPPPFTANYGEQGVVASYSFTGPDAVVRDPATDEIEAQCWEKFVGDAMLIYEASATNPMHLDRFELTRACLVEAGLVDASYTRENWEADTYYDAIADGAVFRSEEGFEAPPEAEETDFDANSEAALACAG